MRVFALMILSFSGLGDIFCIIKKDVGVFLRLFFFARKKWI